MPKITEERRVLAALAILVSVGLLSLVLAFNRQAQIREDAPVEGPPSPTCVALTSFNFADLLAIRLAATPGFTPQNAKVPEQIKKLAEARTKLQADASDYDDLAATRTTFIEHTLRAEPVSEEDRTAANNATAALVEAQRKKCPATKPGTSTAKRPGSSTTTKTTTTRAPGT